jgi:hypothetical protein
MERNSLKQHYEVLLHVYKTDEVKLIVKLSLN